MYRKLPIFLVVFIFVFLFAGPMPLYAAQDVANMSASVSVNSRFEMGIFPTSLDFPAKDPEQTTDIRETTLWCSSNNNNPWVVEIYNLSELTSGAYTISNDNFNWWGWSTGSGAWHAGTGKMSTTPFICYEAGMNEYITTTTVEIHLGFNVNIPANQPAGIYTSAMIVKMRDTSTFQEVEHTLNVTVEVNPKLTMSLSEANLYFGEVDPNSTTDTKALYLFCETNANSSWEVRISVISPLTSETYTIPNENFHWWGWATNGSGTWNPGTGYLDTSPQTFYNCGIDEVVTSSPIEITLQFNIGVPKTQAMGTYSTTMVLTMTE